jgi:hypothetical protein
VVAELISGTNRDVSPSSGLERHMEKLWEGRGVRRRSTVAAGTWRRRRGVDHAHEKETKTMTSLLAGGSRLSATGRRGTGLWARMGWSGLLLGLAGPSCCLLFFFC